MDTNILLRVFSMLEVELDIFSGRPNPVWILSESEEKELADIITSDPTQISPVYTESEQFSLGYRGLIVREIKTDKGIWSNTNLALESPIPREFRVGSKPGTLASAAEWLLQTSENEYKYSHVTDELREVAARGVALVQSSREVVDPATFISPLSEDNEYSRFPTITGEGVDSPGGDKVGARGTTWWACSSNYFSANANVFNDPAHVLRNNCYCFASNHLADVRYALPGRRGGRPARSMTCSEVTAGLYADGWRDGCQLNGLTIAMVIWPGVDYHFYRLVTGGPNWWWGHKPGGTPAKYTDDCGHSIYQYNGRGYSPKNCCRGSYTDFCGYFYQNNSTAFVA
jgi:hypothetical protein